VQPGKNVPLPFICASILYNPPIQKRPSKEKWDLQIAISGIYILDQHFFLQLEAENKSPIGYDIDFLRFSVKDGNKAKRTAAQEVIQNPLFIAGNTKEIKAFSKTVMVVALEKFTIPDAKYFSVEMGEKNGGRQLELKIKNKHLLKARLLPESR
jgi:conjugative transposon TraN protein